MLGPAIAGLLLGAGLGDLWIAAVTVGCLVAGNARARAALGADASPGRASDCGRRDRPAAGRCPSRWTRSAPPRCQTEGMVHTTTAADLRVAIEHSGYYPELVAETIQSAIAGEEVRAFLVHHEATFDRDELRRHVTVLVLTPARLVVGHTDDSPPDESSTTPVRRQLGRGCPALADRLGGGEPYGRRPRPASRRERRLATSSSPSGGEPSAASTSSRPAAATPSATPTTATPAPRPPTTCRYASARRATARTPYARPWPSPAPLSAATAAIAPRV